MSHHAITFALLSAVLFGLSMPATKGLLSGVHPAVLAGLLYLGAGIGVGIWRRGRGAVAGSEAPREQSLTRADAPWLALAVTAGGIVGPILAMYGLAHTSATTASLLLTLEGVATALLAWFVFNEHFDRRIALGMGALVAGAVVLSWPGMLGSGTPGTDGVVGPLAIVGACIAWGLDNNFTRKVSLSDPLQIVEIKGLVAGPINLALGLLAGGHLPGLPTIGMAGLIGFLSYGVSLVLFVMALRHLGTARTGAYFSTAPFIGAAAAVLLLGEALSWQLGVAGLLMAWGVWLHISEVHEHDHVHEALEHGHAHSHDAHHQHVTRPGRSAGRAAHALASA